MKTLEDIKPFADLLEREQLEQHNAQGYTFTGKRYCKVSVKIGGKYARVDVGNSGKYMVVLETGEIFGRKAYGVIHRGHQYGTLDTIHEWDWRPYQAQENGQAVNTSSEAWEATAL